MLIKEILGLVMFGIGAGAALHSFGWPIRPGWEPPEYADWRFIWLLIGMVQFFFGMGLAIGAAQ